MKESLRAQEAWKDYLAAGPSRSIDKLFTFYQERQRNDSTLTAPTTNIRRLFEWSRLFGWQARLAALADQAAKEAEERDLAYRRAILEEGYGLKHERVKALKDLAGALVDDLTNDGRRWVSDYKQIGFEVVEIQRFNASEVEQLRGLLDDIAKEKSERKAVTEITGKDGSSLLGDGLTDDERTRRLAAVLDRARTRITGPDSVGSINVDSVTGSTDGSMVE